MIIFNLEQVSQQLLNCNTLYFCPLNYTVSPALTVTTLVQRFQRSDSVVVIWFATYVVFKSMRKDRVNILRINNIIGRTV